MRQGGQNSVDLGDELPYMQPQLNLVLLSSPHRLQLYFRLYQFILELRSTRSAIAVGRVLQ